MFVSVVPVEEMKVNERRDGNAAAEILERPKSVN
jgi:hypothetical protein